jgi:D-alanyl-D-alanine carboxypeptidase
MIVKEPSITYKTNISEYLEYLHSKDEYIFTLANKENPLERDFPEDKDSLIEIPSEYRKDSVIYLYTVAEKALEAMMNDMFALGYNDVYVTSAYRSYAYQEVLFNMYVEDEMESGLSYDQAVQKVLTYSSEPGKSEHQTGLCVDFTTKSIGGVVDDSFESTAVFQWLKNNAWKYGFILRYPEDKTNITGYSYESWHYRFVGVDIASVIYQTGICYEEYLEIFGKN